MSGIALSLKEIEEFHQHFLNKPIPKWTPFTSIMRCLVKEVGFDKLLQYKKERDRE